ncbi:hypothetical protein HOLleu_29807 [Holothuria leucospilota]|uniref:Uncharacterized protein n=1 Tax=Holothuria leucospilota TaxID=206669 RepID=A0A9Q1BJG0_HOLLE|nr:hypothetical protein HOLleu_29807 [Holothuria leucospilota]
MMARAVPASGSPRDPSPTVHNERTAVAGGSSSPCRKKGLAHYPPPPTKVKQEQFFSLLSN